MNLRALLLVSLGLNVTLGLAWTLGAKSPAFSFLPGSAASSGAASSGQSPGGDGALNSKSSKASSQEGARAWANLYSSDPKRMAESLRAAGIPEKYVRAMIRTALDEAFSSRRKALFSGELPPYWQVKGPRRIDGLDMDKVSQLNALNREQTDLMKSILGPSTSDRDDYALIMRQRYGNLPPEKLESAARISQDYSEMQSRIYQQSNQNGFMLPEDRDKLQTLKQEQELDMKALMTSAEYEEYQLRSSTTAQNMQRQLRYMDPTEAEYRTLFALQKAVDDQSSGIFYGVVDEATMQQRAVAEKALMDQVKAALGEARFQDYERSKDINFQTASRIAEAYNLPTENAVAVYDLKKQVDAQMRDFRSQNPAERAQALQVLNADVSAKLQQYLGVKGVAAYRQSSAYMWAKNIERMAKASTSSSNNRTP